MATIRKSGSQLAIKGSDCAVVCCDSDDVVISWDVQAERMFGLKHADAIGNRLFHLILPENSELRGTPQLSRMFHQYRKETSVTLKVEDTARRSDGHRFPVELVVSPLPGGDYFTIFIRSRASLEYPPGITREEIFKLEVINSIFTMSLEPSLLKDRLQAILGYLVSLEELQLLPMAALFLVEQDTDTLILRAQHGLAANPGPVCKKVSIGSCYCGKAALSNKLQFIGGEAVGNHDHGEAALAEPHGHYCVPVASHGIVTGVLCCYLAPGQQRSALTEKILSAAAGVIAAILEHQKMDLQLINLVNDLRASIIALREEQSFSESIIQGLEHGLIVADKNGVIQKSNDVAKEIFTPFTENLEGRRLSSLIGSDNARRILARTVTENQPEENELTLTTAGGDDLILRYSAVIRQDSRGFEAGTIISLTDISEWRHVRKEMEKMNRLSTVAEIASAVAHEVRNPLAGIKIMAQSIEEGSGTEEERLECSQRIIRQVDRLNELLTDFFSYARPVVPKQEKTSLQDILAEIKPLIVNKLVKQRIYLLEDFEKDLPPVYADPNQIQQVFLNLFLNAIDAIRQEGTIEIKAQKISGQKLARIRKRNLLPGKAKQYVMVLFRDNGAGMSPEAAEKVFEPFYTTKTNGSGLGMSIVYRTLKENEAVISVESSEGKGTTFSMFFKTA